SKSNLTLSAVNSHAGVDQRVIDGGVDHTAVIDAPATTKAGLAIAIHVIGKTNAGTNIVSVVYADACLRYCRVRINRQRISLVFVAHAQIQSDARADSPVILQEIVKVGRLHGQAKDA